MDKMKLCEVIPNQNHCIRVWEICTIFTIQELENTIRVLNQEIQHRKQIAIDNRRIYI